MKRKIVSQLVWPVAVFCLASPLLADTQQPTSGEQIKWQVVSGGDQRGTSTNFVVSGTLGQTAVGPGTSTGYKANHGFWQASFGGGGCCIGQTGDTDCSGDGIVDISDLTRLIDYMFISLTPLCCQAQGNTDASPDNIIDISDLTRLIDHMFISLGPTEACL